MTPADLRRAGETLFGPQWQTALARELGVADRTVRRWVAGKVPVGPHNAAAINRLLALRGHRPVGTPSLAHVTLNTGNLVHSPRDNVFPETVRWLAPMVAAGRGEPAGIPFLVTHRGAGTALFTIDVPPVVLCGVCWDEARSAEAWDAMLRVMHAQGVEAAPAERPATPWLGVAFLPAFFGLLGAPEKALQLGDMERCIGWALIEQAAAMAAA